MGEAGKPVLFMLFCVADVACSIMWSKMSKLDEVSYEMLVFLHPRVLSRVAGFPVSPCLWGKLDLLFECVQAGCHVIFGRRGTL